jgi:hypothetical protein
MERAEAQVIGTPFFKFDEGTHNFHNINAAEYLLYGILCYQKSMLKLLQFSQFCCAAANPKILYFVCTVLWHDL